MAVMSPSKLKESIRQSFRKACIKRLEGQEGDAVKILQEELPAQIKQWHELEGTEPAEIEGLLAEELARTESAFWVVQATEERLKKGMQGLLTESQMEGVLAVWNAKHQMELNALKTKLEGTLSEVITYQGAEAMGGRIAQELAERVRAAVGEVFGQQREALKEVATKQELEILAKKSDVEAALWQAQNAIGERIDGKLKLLEGQAQQGAEALEVVLAEVKAILNARLQGIVSAEMFESRLMAATGMLQESQQKVLQETTAAIQTSVDRKLGETLTPIQQRIGSLMTFQDWERAEKESNQKMLWQASEQQAQMLAQLTERQGQALNGLSVQQQNFLNGLQRDWELLHKSLEELRRRQGSLETDLKAVATVVEDFRTEQVKTRESVTASLILMTDQLKAMDEANRQLKLSLPQALQSFERQTENRLRDQAQLYQAEVNALHRKLETGLTEAFAKKLKSLKIVSE